MRTWDFSQKLKKIKIKNGIIFDIPWHLH
jgi:hypothetical protein